MKVKDLVLKLDNSGTKFKFYEADEKTLVVISDVDQMKRTYKDGTIGEVFNRNVKKWVIEGMGESILVILK
jgi:hypothetical protein